MIHQRTDRGIIHVLTMALLMLLVVLATMLATTSTVNLSAGDNHRHRTKALLAAESGLAFILGQIQGLRLPASTTPETFTADLTQALGERLHGTANLAGASVTAVGSTVYIPQIQLPEGSFSSTFSPVSDERCELVVLGTFDGVSRRVSIELVLTPRQSDVFDYGVVSRGTLTISGNAKVLGVNDPSEASIMSATTDEDIAISLEGNAVVAGNATVVEDPRYLSVSGNPSLGGTSDPEEMAQHILTVPEAPDFPEVDTASLAPLATNIVDASTDVSSPGLVLSNIRIVAGTNPAFSSDIVLNGIVYVEAPNIVMFTAKTTLNGLVVAEGTSQDINDCQMHFSGQVEAFGVEALPDTPEFEAVKQQTGTFVLAPGFQVTFSGHFSAINGTIAADKLTFTGTAEGVVKGSLIGLANHPMTLGGTVDIHVDRENANPDPAGFKKSIAMVADAATYSERTGE